MIHLSFTEQILAQSYLDLHVEPHQDSRNQQSTACFWDYGTSGNHVNHDRTETLREKNTPNNNTDRQGCRLGGAVLASFEGQKVALTIAAFPVIPQHPCQRESFNYALLICSRMYRRPRGNVKTATKKKRYRWERSG